MRTKTIIYLCLLLFMFLAINSQAQYKVETFGKYIKRKAIADLPTDFKNVFPLKAEVNVQLTHPEEPEFYTINCYWINEEGQEILTGTTDLKYFDKKSDKLVTGTHSLGIMYKPGKYIVKALKQSDKSTIAESEYTVTAETAAPSRSVATVIFCEDTDDNFNPIKPITEINAGENVNFLAKLKEGIGAKFFIWAAFEIKADGDEVLYKDMQEHVDNETNRWFATIQKTTFTKPGRYAVYMLYQNATNNGMTIRKPTNYYARGEINVK